jgi:uncharacterized protein YaaQ
MPAVRASNNGGTTVATNSNFLVKVTDAKMPAVKKALEEAGIEVRSIIAVHKEETGSEMEVAESGDSES